MKVLISILVLFFSLNLKAEYFHCDHMSFEEGGSYYINYRRFSILDFDLENNIILSYQFEYRSRPEDFKNAPSNSYPDSLLEYFLSDEYNSSNYLKTDLKKLMYKPIKKKFKIIRNTHILVEALNTSPSEERSWIKFNLINGKGLIERRRVNCNIIGKNVFDRGINDFENFYFD